MKRRASQQLGPESQSQQKDQEKKEIFSDTEANDSETCPSERKLFKARRNKGNEEKVEPASENFLNLLAFLGDPLCEQKTNERIAKLEEDHVENSTPRKVLPSLQKEFLKIKCFQMKIWVKDVCLGKGELQVLKRSESQCFFLVFRNCIQKVLFNGMVFKFSKVERMQSKCKEKHDRRVDLEVTLLKQPEGKFCKVLVCGEEEQVKELEMELKEILKKIDESEKVESTKTDN
jgi:hypothetical protein